MFHDKRRAPLTAICPVWSRLLLTAARGHAGQQTAGWAVEKNVNFIHHLLACIFVHTFGTHACVHVCLHLNLAVVSVSERRSGACPPARKEPPDTPALRQPGHADSSGTALLSLGPVCYHESRMSLARRPDSRQLPHPQPNLRPFKSADFSQFLSSSFRSCLRLHGPFSAVSNRGSSIGSVSPMKLK